MSNFTKRTLTGIGLIVVVLTAVWLGAFCFAGLLLLINLLGLHEFYRMLETSPNRPVKIAVYILSASLIFSSLMVSSGMSWKWLLVNLPIAFSIFIIALYQGRAKPFQGLANTFLGIIYISLPLCFFLVPPFLLQAGGVYHFQIPAGIFLLLWSGDTGAYLSGNLFGKHPLFQRISPHKTWEGSLGGAFAALITAYVLSRYVNLLSVSQWETLALIVIVFGTYGDLVKSMLKRSVRVKDTGTILPGHGGVLDRFDSLLGAAPFILIYLTIIWR
ncbi:phosphatidate cytidylyltransferase [Mucilaginibacter ximonensis]|uniref:Phosphatidate cytidylyltransferase n=1 Tax=Mucilaginibacter ximonensis TaxID=538021 RepID=A0ABW5YC61_9SPHI